jgi:hypothetical protein
MNNIKNAAHPRRGDKPLRGEARTEAVGVAVATTAKGVGMDTVPVEDCRNR